MLRQPGSRRPRAGRMGCWLCVKGGELGRDTEEVGPELYPRSALSAGLSRSALSAGTHPSLGHRDV